MQNSAFRNISNLGFCRNSVTLNINLKSERKHKFQEICTKLEMKTCFLEQSWIKHFSQIDQINYNRFFYGMLYSLFFAFL